MIADSRIRSDRLRRVSNAHAREVTTAGKRLESQLELDARLALDEDLRLSTRRTARPSSARLESRLAIGGTPSEVDFIGRGGPTSSASGWWQGHLFLGCEKHQFPAEVAAYISLAKDGGHVAVGGGSRRRRKSGSRSA